jgi:hypothetical protein
LLGVAGRLFSILKERNLMGNAEARYSEREVIEKRLIPGITNRITLHRKRKLRLIGFYKIGNKVFYGDSHISDFLTRCERKAKGKGGGQ